MIYRRLIKCMSFSHILLSKVEFASAFKHFASLKILESSLHFGRYEQREEDTRPACILPRIAAQTIPKITTISASDEFDESPLDTHLKVERNGDGAVINIHVSSYLDAENQ